MLECFFLPPTFFFFSYNLDWFNMTITDGKSPKIFPFKRNLARNSPLLLLLYILPFPCALANAVTLQQELSDVFPGGGWCNSATPPEKKNWSHYPNGKGLSPSVVAQGGSCFQRGRDTLAAVISL